MNKLKVEKLSHSYGSKLALDDVSFEVNDGLIGILGHNGAGKTTMMKLITTLFAVQKGSILLNNLDYKKDIGEIRKHMGYLPQDFKVHGSLTGMEFLEVMLNLRNDKDKKYDKKHLDDIVESLEMGKYIKDKIKSYSGGMKQKLGFAQVLIGDPKIVVVDEPTVGLDPEQRNTIRDLFPVISKDRIVLASTHIVEDIEYYCDALLVMREGKLIYNGTKEAFVEISKDKIWKVPYERTLHGIIKAKAYVLSNNGSEIRYISDEKLSQDSLPDTINLQDAYISYQGIHKE